MTFKLEPGKNCTEYAYVGSRVTCNPAPTDTDRDILVLCVEGEMREVMQQIYDAGMQIKTIVFRLKESNMQATFRLRNEQKQILKKIKATNKSPAAQAARFSSPTAQRRPGKLGKA